MFSLTRSFTKSHVSGSILFEKSASLKHHWELCKPKEKKSLVHYCWFMALIRSPRVAIRDPKKELAVNCFSVAIIDGLVFHFPQVPH